TYFSIKSHRIKAQTLGGEGVWYSQIFSIAGYTGVQIDAKISNEGSKSSSEYVKVYHKLDNGPEILDTAMYGNMGTALVKSAPMTGSKVQIVIRIYDTTKGNSEYYIEQYDVFKEVGPCSVSGITVTATASNSGVLTCTTPSVTLSASGATTYSWSGPNGFTSTSANPVVSVPGNYLVVGTSSSGTGSASVTVAANNAPPDISATGGAMGCSTSATISATSSVSGATFRWTGPGGFSSTLASTTVSAAGSYTVTVTNPATGCTASQTVAVTTGVGTPAVFWLEDFTFPNGTVSDAGSTPWTATTTGTGTYSVQNNEFKTSFSGQSEGVWTSGLINIAGKTNMVLSVDLRSETASTSDAFETADYVRVYYKLDGGPETPVYDDQAGIGSSTTGTSSITITPSIPVGSTLQIVIRTSDSDPTERYFFDNVKLSGIDGVNALASAGGSLTCTRSSVTLSGSSTSAGAVYSWTGPGSFTSTVQNPVVSTPGIYTLTVTVGGCSASDTALVAQDILVPQGLTTTSIPSASQLTCTNNNVVFTAASTTPGTSYSWVGPGGFSATGVSATATVVGVYTLTATNTANGCTATSTSTVTSNTAIPGGVTTTATPATAQITCTHPTVLLTSSSTTAGVTYSWTGPSGFTATGASATAAAPGTYTVTVTDPVNGCFTTLPGTVTRNVSVPIGLTASPSDIISCFTPTIDLQGASTTPGVTYSWAGPGGYTAATAIAETEVPGNYTLTVTNPANGCSSSTGTVVLADTATPAGVTASNNGPLNCINTSVDLRSSSTSTDVDFLWVTPDNNFIAGQAVVVTVPGTYTIVVTNDNNGCSTQAVTTVVRNTTGCAGGAGFAGGAASGVGGRPDMSADTLFDYKVYPNPFSSTTLVTFHSPTASLVTVELFNSVGVRERMLFNKTVVAGQTYSLSLGSAGLAPGTHFCVIRSNGKAYSTKLLLVR
ncbi:MAG: T9SS type A sorting domain-containing protein, partial [Bacteroidetes bacterium]|nr:T9SS type A sorting domain-containing protein [Bacteroidota bacterium]